eukprot:1104787-Amphidinium_carterae.1
MSTKIAIVLEVTDFKIGIVLTRGNGRSFLILIARAIAEQDPMVITRLSGRRVDCTREHLCPPNL